MAPNPRANAALTTMKTLGIGKEKVKSVLKRLLKLYDKNWELIEEDGYRALVDAIFDEEDNMVEKKRKCRTDEEDYEEEAHTNELERKKMRSRNPECSAGSPLTQPQMIYSRDHGIQSRSSGAVFRENIYEAQTCSVTSSRDEPFGDEVPLNVLPIAMRPPDSSLMLEPLHGKPNDGGINAGMILCIVGGLVLLLLIFSSWIPARAIPLTGF